MSERFEIERVKTQNHGDSVFFFLLLLLAGVGTAVLFSSTYYTAELYEGDALFFLKKRLAFLVLGSLAYLAASRLSLVWLRRQVPFIILGSLLLLAATFLPGLGRTVMGGVRWIRIAGFSFQPSELAKVSLTLYLAAMLSKNEGRMDEPINTVLPPLIMTALFVGIVFFQNDFSTALFIFLLALAIFFVANVRVVYFILIAVVTLPLTVIMLFTKEHRVERLITFLSPEMDPSGTGFQIIAARDALMRGSFWGQGLGSGVKKLGALPEVHSDFLFASLGEEAGFFGVFFVLVLFLLLAIRGYYIALGCRDKFSYYLGFGLTSSILYQAFFNMAVVAGLVPATGIPLPFFSAGGSSLLVTFIMCGLLQNIYRNQEVRDGEGSETLQLFPDQSWMTQGWTYEGSRGSGDPLRFRVDPSLLEGRRE